MEYVSETLAFLEFLRQILECLVIRVTKNIEFERVAIYPFRILSGHTLHCWNIALQPKLAKKKLKYIPKFKLGLTKARPFCNYIRNIIGYSTMFLTSLIFIFFRWDTDLYMSFFPSIRPSIHPLSSISKEPYIIWS